jgi:stearoyl-CoA desaturase (delta-9 desaturase)
VLGPEKPRAERLLIGPFTAILTLAVPAAVPLAWGWGLSWADIGLAACGLRIALAITGSLELQGDVISWAADHRRHHALTDKEGDPHSPWLFGTTPAALARGLWHAHTGRLFGRDRTNAARFAPDLLADRDIARISRQFPLWAIASLLAPAMLGGLVSMSWWAALTAFYWAGLIRVGLLHHITWSINSICHMIGRRPLHRVGQGHELLAAGDSVDGRVLAQPAPRRPDVRPPRCRAWPDRDLRADDPGPRAPRVGHRRPLARDRPPRSAPVQRAVGGPGISYKG